MKMHKVLAAFIATLAALAHAQAFVITTVAGGGVGDFGSARDAAINAPVAVAFDPSGSLYVADQGFNRIRRVDRDTGIITTYAGTGEAGFAGDGGNALAAQFSSIAALAFDGQGNLYVADGGNDRIRRIDAASGMVTTIAGGGDGTAGTNDVGDGAIATAAILANPAALAMDASGGGLYVADQYDNRIRRIDLATGVIQTIAGNGAMGYSGDGGPAVAARLNNPAAIALAPNGDLYIADRNNVRVRKVDARSGVITTVAGGPRLAEFSPTSRSTGGLDFDVHAIPFAGEGGPATAAPLLRPSGLALDTAGNLFIADAVLARVLRVDASTAIITSIAGIGAADDSGDGGPAKDAGLSFPAGLAFDGSGNLFVADRDNNMVRTISTTGVISAVAGNGDAFFTGDGGDPRNALLAAPLAVAFDSSGELIISDTGNLRIRKVGRDGAIRTIAGGGSGASFACSRRPVDPTSLRLFFPEAIAVTADDAIIVPLGNSNVVCKLGTDGLLGPFAGDILSEFSEFFGDNGDGHLATVAGLASPVAAAVNRAGDVFISDDYASRVRRVGASDGIITTFAGTGTGGFRGDGGPASNARLQAPSFLAADEFALYVSDTGNNRVRRIDFATGTITTIAGNGDDGFSGDGGPATAASLSGPAGLAIDAAGNLYIADRGNHRIRKLVRANATLVTIAGSGEAGFSGDGGDALAATLNHPAGLAIDAAGNLYVADQDNNRVRRISAARAGSAR